MPPHEPYVPQDISEIWDLLASMMADAPLFVDKSGFFLGRNIDTEFFSLKKGLGVVRKKLGEERYAKLIDMADRMRAHFEADPEDKTEDGRAGRRLILEMEEELKQIRGWVD